MAAIVEFPYANVGGQMVTAENARLLGKDLANAISVYLQKKHSNAGK